VELFAENRPIMHNVYHDYPLLTARVIYDVNFAFHNHRAGFS